MKNNIIVGLDIGTTKICAIVGRKNKYGKLEILGMGKSTSSGVSGGMVSNIDKATVAIKKAIEEAKIQSNVNIEVVNVGIAGKHISSTKRSRDLKLDNPDKKITVEDVNRLADQVYNCIPPNGKEIIHVMAQDYCVDGEEGILDPVGMIGSDLEGNFHVTSADPNAIKYINKAIEQAGIVTEDFILESLASSLSVLSDEEKEAGVCLVDIGGGDYRHSGIL